MYPELKDKVVVVTGAGAGIGRGIARRFGREESIVVVNDLRPETAKKVAAEISAAGGRAIALAGDMTKESDVKQVFDQVMRTYGRVDILVNNVGLFEFGELVGSAPEGWDKDFTVNVRSAYLCSNRVAQEMKKAGAGRIINIASGAGKIGGTWSRGYGATKWAVLGLTKSLAAELAPDIRVNAVCPGIIDTDMDAAFVEKIAARQGVSPEEFKAARAASIPLKRIGTPEDVAKAVAFLASDEASYTIGEAFNLSGGLVMH
jgi:NAD(P)-dependent dehydrogenase (short-subunit alcohol dehydrogenase family)